METVLYADILFLVNFAMDFISLSASASLGAVTKKPLRLCIASALGAVYGVAATASGIGGILQYIAAALVGGAMCIISFGFDGVIPFIRQCIIFGGCGALLAGIMTAVLSFGSNGNDASFIIPTAISACVVLFFVIRALSARSGCKDMGVKITYGGKTIEFTALCDSGNLLRDPFSGRPVLLISGEELSALLPPYIVSALISCDTEILSANGIMPRLIPRGSEDGASLVCAIRPDMSVITAGKRSVTRDLLIAPTDKRKNYYAGYPATAPSVLIP